MRILLAALSFLAMANFCSAQVIGPGMAPNAANAILPDARTNLGLGTSSTPTFAGLVGGAIRATTLNVQGAGSQALVSGFNAQMQLGTDSNLLFGPGSFFSGSGAAIVSENDAQNAQQPLYLVGTTTVISAAASGGLQVGAPTSGDKGAGTLNTAGGIFQNNVAVPTISSASTLSNKTLDATNINQEAHEDSFTSNTSSGFTTITNLDQTFVATGKYSCNGHMHFTTAPTTSNGVKLQLASDGTSSITTLNFTAIGFNGAAFATTGTGTATALGSTAIAASQAFSDILLNAEIVVNAGGVIHVQFNENATSGTIAGNARWNCHRAA